ncbi:phage integrase [Roseobacter sp. AzwK-3b]|uniref:tyrosine-type recombinase/integrase n=1 Tax=Roseobacter sp. AzwK-3b TaxID=351016 RepID=UPI000156A3B7|nr:tyrosine-type recombinase/integrase [Roseobacter sp. AzwK-3b]EDM70793.1 phage integrase [Roseobacter sp. AzwK-3b]
MVKRQLPKYVYARGRKGYPYFIRGNTCQRIFAEPGSNAFWAEYNRLLNGAPTAPKRTINKLIEHYMRSPDWAKKAHNTRKSYERSFLYFRDKIGLVDPASIRRRHVNDMRDALSATPTTANRRVAALSVLMNHAIDIGWVEHVNPARGVKQLDGTKTREAWPVDMVEAFRTAATGQTLLLFELLIGTGQRIGDVLNMQWGQIEDNGIVVRQSKTKAEVWIPFTRRLLDMLNKTPRNALYIINHEGHRVAYNTAWKWVMDVRKQIGATDYDIHGLRHTAASELAALGMTDEEIMSITGHTSAAMVRLYAGKAAQKARAKKVQEERG